MGFYSAFIVADKVVVRTRRAGMQHTEGVYWESDGKGEYTVKNIERKGRGTEITLFLKSDQDEYLSHYTLQNIIRKYIY